MEIQSKTEATLQDLKKLYKSLSKKYIIDYIKYDPNYHKDIDKIFSRQDNYEEAINVVKLLEELDNTGNEKKLFIELAESLLEMGKRNPWNKDKTIHYNFAPSAFEKGPGVCWLILAYQKNYYNDLKDIMDYYSWGNIEMNEYIEDLINSSIRNGRLNDFDIIDYFPENIELINDLIHNQKYYAYGFLMFISYNNNDIEECKNYTKLFKQYSSLEERKYLINKIKDAFWSENISKYKHLLEKSNVERYLLKSAFFLIIK